MQKAQKPIVKLGTVLSLGTVIAISRKDVIVLTSDGRDRAVTFKQVEDLVK